MIKITIGDIAGRKEVIVSTSKILSEVASENGVNLAIGSTNINGRVLLAEEHNMSLSELGVTDGAFILSYPKAQGN